jgi:hypothetical protein
VPAGEPRTDAHSFRSSGIRQRRDGSGALWRVRSRAQTGLLAAMAGTVAIVAALVGVIVGVAGQAPTASVRATIEAGPSSVVSRSVSWRWDAGDEHPSSRAVRAALRKAFVGLPVVIERDDTPPHSARWTVTPDAADIGPDELAAVRRAESRLVDVVRGLPALSDTPVTASGGGIDTLRDMERANAALSAVLPVPASVLAVAGVIALALLAQLLVDARDNETRLLRARGASVRAIVLADATETIVAALAGCLAGGAAAATALALTVGMPSVPWLLLPCAGVFVGSVLIVVSFAAVAATRASGEARQVSGRTRLGISAGSTLVLLAIAGISMWRFVQGQASSGPVDPIAVIAPAAVLCALAAFAVIFFGPASTAIEAGVSRSPGVASLPLRLVSRHAAVFAAPVALLTLAVAVSTFAGGYQATWSSFLASSSRLVVGGDARVDLDAPQFVSGPSDASPVRRIAEVPDVSVAAPAVSIPAGIGPLSLDLIGMRAKTLPALNTAPDAMFDAKAIAGRLTKSAACSGSSGPCRNPDSVALDSDVSDSEVPDSEVPDSEAQGSDAAGVAGAGIRVPPGARNLDLAVVATASAPTTAQFTAWFVAATGETIPVSADDVPVRAKASVQTGTGQSGAGQSGTVQTGGADSGSTRPGAEQVRIPVPPGTWTVEAFDISVDVPDGRDGGQASGLAGTGSLGSISVAIASVQADGHRLSSSPTGWQLQGDVYENGTGVVAGGHAGDLGFDGSASSTTASSVRVRLAPKAASSVVPVAISSAAAAETGLGIGSTTTADLPQGSLRLVVVAVPPHVPGTRQAAAAMVDLPTLTTAMLHTVQDLPAVDTVFVGTRTPATAHGGRLDSAALARAAGSGSIVVPGVALPSRFIGPVVLALELGAIGCCALAAVALAASLAALWRRRRSETVILRAIGFAPSTQARSRAAEAALAVGYAVVCGVLAGILVTLVAGNALARKSVPGAPPALPVVGTFDIAWLAACLCALLVVLALVVLQYGRALHRHAMSAAPGRTTT